MTLLEVKPLAIEGVRVLRFERRIDKRGYFTETFRRSCFLAPPLSGMLDSGVLQSNESYSRAGVIRGLHFQWDPPMGKLVRTVHGHMIDLVLDLRPGSATFGQALAYDLPEDSEVLEAIWVPPGCAHGNSFLEDTRIEYLCSAEYNPAGEAGISPLAGDIDWRLCDPPLLKAFREIAAGTELMTDKDRHGLSIQAWQADPRSQAHAQACGRALPV